MAHVSFSLPAAPQDENAGLVTPAARGKGAPSARAFGTPLAGNAGALCTPGAGLSAARGKTPATGLGARPRRALGDITNSVRKAPRGGLGGGAGGKAGLSKTPSLNCASASRPTQTNAAAPAAAVRAQEEEIARLAEEYAQGPCEGISLTHGEWLAQERAREDAAFRARAAELIAQGPSRLARARAEEQEALWGAVEDSEVALRVAQEEMARAMLPDDPPLADEADAGALALELAAGALDLDLALPELPAVELAGPTAFEMREEGDSDGEGLS